mmetsp:Transcript_24050/g.83464  ORF Transcript_24050/g.83464 Transcript_24050/m.83464 type:complete len:328 (-) Transcript_24050:3215-4198(-)
MSSGAPTSVANAHISAYVLSPDALSAVPAGPAAPTVALTEAPATSLRLPVESVPTSAETSPSWLSSSLRSYSSASPFAAHSCVNWLFSASSRVSAAWMSRSASTTAGDGFPASLELAACSTLTSHTAHAVRSDACRDSSVTVNKCTSTRFSNASVCLPADANCAAGALRGVSSPDTACSPSPVPAASASVNSHSNTSSSCTPAVAAASLALSDDSDSWLSGDAEYARGARPVHASTMACPTVSWMASYSTPPSDSSAAIADQRRRLSGSPDASAPRHAAAASASRPLTAARFVGPPSPLAPAPPLSPLALRRASSRSRALSADVRTR